MFPRSFLLSLIMAISCTAAPLDEPRSRPGEVPGWGRVVDPWRDCDVSLDREDERLTIRVPGTPHVLSAEVPQLPMNAPLVVRRVRGDFTASVHVLGQFEPGPSRTTHYDPYHGAGLIAWQDASNYLRLERAVGFINGRHHAYVNYELRAGGRLAVSYGFTIGDGPLFLRLRRRGAAFWAWYSRDGRRWSALRRIDAEFAESVEVGAVAVNSSDRTLTAELEMLDIEDPRGSRARDDGGRDTEAPPPAPSAPKEGKPSKPRRPSVLYDPTPRRKSPIGDPAPPKPERAGFPW
jgi:regulation of enolase protein 1 (concanavalin A-like superfamily)